MRQLPRENCRSDRYRLPDGPELRLRPCALSEEEVESAMTQAEKQTLRPGDFYVTREVQLNKSEHHHHDQCVVTDKLPRKPLQTRACSEEANQRRTQASGW